MSNDLMLDVGQANELKLAFRRASFTNDDIKRLCEGSILSDVRNVLRGYAAINATEHIIDCDAHPFIPDSLSVKEHQKGGAFKWDKEVQKNALYVSEEKQIKAYVQGDELRRELAKKPVLNANVLDYLLKNPHLIPEEWKDKNIFFWGTVYYDSNHDLYIRFLFFAGNTWHCSDRFINDAWNCHSPAAIRAA